MTPLRLTLVVCSAVASLGSTPARGVDAPLRWEERAGQSLALCDHDSVVWQFNYGPEQTKPFFHPLALPNSPPLTANRPPDHAWHHGLWFSWVSINGVNYWEHEPQGARPAGSTRWSDVKIEPGDDYSARITMELQYAAGGKEPVLNETRTLRISPPDQRGQYAIDWQSEFVAASDATLATTPIPPAEGGVPWGGYGGLAVRLAENMQDREVYSSAGKGMFGEDGVYRGRGAASDYSGAIGGQVAGVAIISHRANPRQPSDWYAICSDMSYLNAAIMAGEPIRLSSGQRYVLRYRIVVHEGRWNATNLADAQSAFDAAPPEQVGDARTVAPASSQ